MKTEQIIKIVELANSVKIAAVSDMTENYRWKQISKEVYEEMLYYCHFEHVFAAFFVEAVGEDNVMFGELFKDLCNTVYEAKIKGYELIQLRIYNNSIGLDESLYFTSK